MHVLTNVVFFWVLGLVGATLSTPLDVIKTRMQMKDSPYKNVADCIAQTWKEVRHPSMFCVASEGRGTDSIVCVCAGEITGTEEFLARCGPPYAHYLAAVRHYHVYVRDAAVAGTQVL